MSKFKIEKKLNLDFLGDEWGDCYLKFRALTTKDLKKVMQSIPADIREHADNPEKVLEAFDKGVELLQDSYIGGKGIGEDGEEVDIDKDDLEDLPTEVLNKALSFLSGESPTQE